MNHRSAFVASLALLITGICNAIAADHSRIFRQIVDTTLSAHKGAIGVMACVISADGSTWSYAAGIADKEKGTPLKPDQPVTTASNTKTYISAAIFRLQEEGKLNINEAIVKHLTTGTGNKLAAAGYDVHAIHITHLLSHTSGIDDYVNDEYFDFVNRNRMYHWTRNEQVDRAIHDGKRLGAPGDTFRYADVNYLLLTEIIENVTHKPFYTSVRELLRYKSVPLNETWFGELEAAPQNMRPLVHQYWDKYPWDTYALHASWDLYGGGGILATPRDMALFYKQLFEGHIIHNKQLLAEMCTAPPCKTRTNYAMGIRILKIAGLTAYYHGGFWGTDVIYFPELKTAICIVVLERSQRDISAQICAAFASELKGK